MCFLMFYPTVSLCCSVDFLLLITHTHSVSLSLSPSLCSLISFLPLTPSHTQICKLAIVLEGAEIMSWENIYSETPFHAACTHGKNLDLIRFFFTCVPSLDTQGTDGHTGMSVRESFQGCVWSLGVRVSFQGCVIR